MNNASETQATRHRVAPGLIERAQERSGVRSDAAFARLLNVPESELNRLRAGGELTVRGLVGISEAFGTPLRDIVATASTEVLAA